MSRENRNGVYVSMMVDSLRNKKKVLEELLDLTRRQEVLLKGEFDADLFNELLHQKGSKIDVLNELDEGFDSLFRSVKEEVTANKMLYKEEIMQMQDLIRANSEIGVTIQSLEHHNSERYKMYLAKEKESIRAYHVNQRTASAYYQNMANVHKNDASYFFDKTK